MNGFGNFYTKHRASHIKKVRRDLGIIFLKNGEGDPIKKTRLAMSLAAELHLERGAIFSYHVFLDYIVDRACNGASYEEILQEIRNI